MNRTFFFIFDGDVGIVVFIVVAVVSKLLETIVHNTMLDDAIIDCRLETLDRIFCAGRFAASVLLLLLLE